MSNAVTSRYCPSCGERTEGAFCPVDGVATLAEGGLQQEAAAVLPGDVIDGRYRITRRLGSGGFGAVYAAEHTGTQQPVAVKLMHPGADNASHEEVRRFHREARITASLTHANTVRVFDVGQAAEGVLYIAMELLRGPTLEEQLRKRGEKGEVLSELEALHVAIPVLKSLQEAHGKGLVHRDLKPANIMLSTAEDDEPVVKVLDFGVARTRDSSLTSTGTALGTPAYMSPEQCAGDPLDARSDLYSLGVILFRCVTGEPPFSDPNPLTVMFKHASAPLPRLVGRGGTTLSSRFVACVEQALAKAPRDRFSDARQMRLACEALLHGDRELRRTAPTGVLRVLVTERGGRPALDLARWSSERTAAMQPAAGASQDQVVVDGAAVDEPTSAQAAQGGEAGPPTAAASRVARAARELEAAVGDPSIGSEAPRRVQWSAVMVAVAGAAVVAALALGLWRAPAAKAPAAMQGSAAPAPASAPSSTNADGPPAAVAAPANIHGLAASPAPAPALTRGGRPGPAVARDAVTTAAPPAPTTAATAIVPDAARRPPPSILVARRHPRHRPRRPRRKTRRPSPAETSHATPIVPD